MIPSPSQANEFSGSYLRLPGFDVSSSAETFINFSKAGLGLGPIGLLHATTACASSQRMTEGEYRSFAWPYGLKLLNALPPVELRILHVGGDYNLLHA